ncbi:MAG: hypothetical protein J6Y77_01975 [Paludibacteraceae bacterium]|nr:hypothetical protein [Paludibacteraceae bacterium]
MIRQTLSAFCQRYRIVLIALANLLFVVGVVRLLPCCFETNDDVVMAWIASGAYNGTPDAHLVFINILYGYLISGLYTLLPGVEWYSWAFLTFHVVSLTVLGHHLLQLQQKTFHRLAAMALLYYLELRILLLLQFTTTSAYVATAALVAMTFGRKKEQVFGLLWFLLAAMIRFKSAMLTGLVFALFYPFLLSLRGFDRRTFVLLSLAVVLSFGLETVHVLAYRSHPQWKSYQIYNHNRANINDNPNARVIYNRLPENVDVNDYILLRCFFADTDIMTVEKLESINEVLGHRRLTSKIRNIQLMKKRWDQYKEILILAFLLTITCGISNGKRGWWLLLPLLGVFFLLTGLSLNNCVKGRIVVTIYLMYMAMTVLLAKPFPFQLQAVLLWMSVIFWSIDYHESLSPYDKRKILDEQCARMALMPSGSVVCGWYAAIHSEYSDPLHVSSTFPIQVKGKGWLAGSPFNEDIARYTDFIDTNKYIFCKRSDYAAAYTLLSRSMLDNYNKTVVCRPKVKDDLYVIFNFVEKDSTANPIQQP